MNEMKAVERKKLVFIQKHGLLKADLNIFFLFPLSETANDRNCPGCRKFCLDYDLWLRFQNALFLVVHDMVFDGAVTLCIILNTAFLAAEHHGMSEDLKHVLDIGNKVFTSFFTLEAVLKLMALSKDYFASGWNIFDLIIVVASLIDLSVESVNGISVLRGMRLVSMFSWFDFPTEEHPRSIMYRSLERLFFVNPLFFPHFAHYGRGNNCSRVKCPPHRAKTSVH